MRKQAATAVVAVLVAAGGVGLFVMMVQRGAWVEQAKSENEALVHDIQNARHLVTAMLLMRELRGRLPMKDGSLDPYSMKDAGIDPPVTFEHFTSMRSEVNPSRSDVESGDYERFAWARYSGEEPVDGELDIPLIWEKQPDPQGRVIVGLLSGSVQVWAFAELQGVLETQRTGSTAN